MNTSEDRHRRKIGRIIGLAIVALAIVAVVMALLQTDRHPRTDDATVRANYIAISAEVSGKLVALPVKDNQLVHKGVLLFSIDPRPYQYVLAEAMANAQLLESRIEDEKRRIAGERNAVQGAQAGIVSSQTAVRSAKSSIDVADAGIDRARSGAASATARLQLAVSNVNRMEPLLRKQYVTVEQVDQVRTARQLAEAENDEAQAALVQAQAQKLQADAAHESAIAGVTQSEAKFGQALHTVDTLDTLLMERPVRAAKIEDAKLQLERCRVVAPFEGYITGMNISEGAYTRPGESMFTLIDMRNWYVIANYRESKLKAIRRGMHADLYLLGHSNRRFNGMVESIGYGVVPEDGATKEGLPSVDRTLNWVHLAARFPVRMHVVDPDPELFRIGASVTTVVR